MNNQQVMIRDEGGSLLKPSSMDELNMLVHSLAHAGMLPKGQQPATAIGSALYGMNAGLNAIQAMSSVAMINGRPSIYGDAAIALVRRSGHLEWIRETIHDDGKGSVAATCEVKRKGEPPHTSAFSMADAKLAGLASKTGPWTQYPKRMLQMRARSFALRDVFADVLMGLDVADIASGDAEYQQPAVSTEDRFNAAVRVTVAPVAQQEHVLVATAEPETTPTEPPTTQPASEQKPSDSEAKRGKWLAAWNKALDAQDWANPEYVDKIKKCAKALDQADKCSEWSEKVEDMLAEYSSSIARTNGSDDNLDVF